MKISVLGMVLCVCAYLTACGNGGGPDDGDGGVPCVLSFNTHTGAEEGDCSPPTTPSCASSFCGTDGQCHVHNFPIGTKCGDTEECDGQGNCNTVTLQCPSSCDDGLECTVDYCATEVGQCFHDSYPRTHVCAGGKGHCNPDDGGSCCEGFFVQVGDAGIDVYICVPICPPGQTADPTTAICL